MILRYGNRVFLSAILVSLSVSAVAQIPNPPSPMTVLGGTSFPAPPPPLFTDSFEYDVPRAGLTSALLFLPRWAGVKATNSGGNGAAGYIYTRPDASLGSRVLVLESVPTQSQIPPGWLYGQTDYYLQLGTAGATVLPPNVWIQFWTYATPESRFAARDKTFYVCRSTYPCTAGQWTWMFLWGRNGFQPAGSEAEYGPVQNRFLALQTETADNRGAVQYPDGATHLFQNVSTAQLVAGQWYQVRMHMDISGPQGTWEAWIKHYNADEWTQVASWRGGVTPNFNWPIPTSERTGHAALRLPTTVNGDYGDSTTYMDDFVIASSEEALPN